MERFEVEKVTTAGFLIFPGFPMSCLTSMIEPLRAANEIVGKQAFKWQLVAELDEKILSSAEVSFDPSTTLEDVEALDFIILLSSPTAKFQNSSTPSILRKLSRHGTTLGAVSGGVFPLVHAGVSGIEKPAVHWCYKSAFEATFPEVEPSDQLIENSNGILTAAGASAAFDLALQLIDNQLGAATATEVACWFQHPLVRRDGYAQIVPSLETNEEAEKLPPIVARAVELFSKNIEKPLSITEIADNLDISYRHVERTFKQATGMSPVKYYRKMRMDAARQIVLYTNDTIAEIASAVGYMNSHTFTKYYLEAHGTTPAQDRKQINQYRYSGNIPVPSV